MSDRDYGRDQYGTELPDLMTARCQAVRFAGHLIAEDPEHVATGETWSMEVTDDTGLLLFQLDFSVAASPATEQARKSAQAVHAALRK